jgi:hypothetical protein
VPCPLGGALLPQPLGMEAIAGSTVLHNKSIDQTAARMSANTLAIADIAEAVSGVIKGRAHRGPAAP